MTPTKHHARGEWITKEDRVIPVADMETSHLINVAKLIAVTMAELLRESIDNYVAAYDYESDFYPGYLNLTSYLSSHAFWPHLCAELDKRHIDVVKLVNDYLSANGYNFRLEDTATPKRFISEDDDNYGLTWPDNL